MGVQLSVAVTVRAGHEKRQAVYRALTTMSAGRPNGELFARMLASRIAGEGALPERLGLTSRQFAALMARHFPNELPERYAAGPELDISRAPEREELRTLFLESEAQMDQERLWVADIIVAGCMGGNHLWQDLGLWSRADVRELLERNFPALAARNDRDMKWKKFLYKQLCNAEGIYICRAPSCEVCDDFDACFGPE